jgi:hypothetical protein
MTFFHWLHFFSMVSLQSSGVSQRLGPPQAKPFLVKAPNDDRQVTGGVFNRLGSSISTTTLAVSTLSSKEEVSDGKRKDKTI